MHLTIMTLLHTLLGFSSLVVAFPSTHDLVLDGGLKIYGSRRNQARTSPPEKKNPDKAQWDSNGNNNNGGLEIDGGQRNQIQAGMPSDAPTNTKNPRLLPAERVRRTFIENEGWALWSMNITIESTDLNAGSALNVNSIASYTFVIDLSDSIDDQSPCNGSQTTGATDYDMYCFPCKFSVQGSTEYAANHQDFWKSCQGNNFDVTGVHMLDDNGIRTNSVALAVINRAVKRVSYFMYDKSDYLGVEWAWSFVYSWP